MTMGERIESLKAKHQALEDAIKEQSRRPHPNDIEVTSLKRQKLRIKEQIISLSN